MFLESISAPGLIRRFNPWRFLRSIPFSPAIVRLLTAVAKGQCTIVRFFHIFLLPDLIL